MHLANVGSLEGKGTQTSYIRGNLESSLNTAVGDLVNGKSAKS